MNNHIKRITKKYQEKNPQKYQSLENLSSAILCNDITACFMYNPPVAASEASREVAILTERKKSTYPLYGVKEFVCLWSTLTQIISGMAKQNGLKKNLGHLWQKLMAQKNFCPKKADMFRSYF